MALVRDYADGQARRRRLRRSDDDRRPTWRRCPRWPRSSGRASGRCCSTSTKTPVTPRSSCSPALFGAGHPVTAVGDPFQSIYGWRGASAGNIGRFAGQFRTVDGRPARGLPAVDQLAQRPADPDRRQRDRQAAAGRHQPPRRRARRRRCDRAAGPCRRRRRVGRGDPRRDGRGRGPLGRAPLAQCWHGAGGAAVARPGGRTAAVLVRRRSQIPLLADALTAAGLPVEVVGLGGLLAMPEVVDIVATLRVLADHRSSTALARLLTGARWRIGPADLAALSRRARWLNRRVAADRGRPRAGARGRRGQPDRGARRSRLAGRLTRPRDSVALICCGVSCRRCATASACRCPNSSPTSSG